MFTDSANFSPQTDRLVLSLCGKKVCNDQTRGMSVSYGFSSSWANRRVAFFTVVGLIIQMVI